MSIKTITADDLRRMKGQEGLILQGCGGDPQEWLDGINDLLTKEGILLNGSKFESCSVFKHDDLTCILYPFEDTELNIGKFAVWRLATHDNFGGTWLSDYVPNRLGGFVNDQKPSCPLIGQNGNIFNLIGIAARTLNENGMSEQAKEMRERCYASDNYSEALNIIGEYVTVTSVNDTDETEDFDEGMGFCQ